MCACLVVPLNEIVHRKSGHVKLDNVVTLLYPFFLCFQHFYPPHDVTANPYGRRTDNYGTIGGKNPWDGHEAFSPNEAVGGDQRARPRRKTHTFT